MVEIERAGHWTGQLEWLPTDRFAKSAPDWAAPEMLGRALSAEARPLLPSNICPRPNLVAGVARLTLSGDLAGTLAIRLLHS